MANILFFSSANLSCLGKKERAVFRTCLSRCPAGFGEINFIKKKRSSLNNIFSKKVSNAKDLTIVEAIYPRGPSDLLLYTKYTRVAFSAENITQAF